MDSSFVATAFAMIDVYIISSDVLGALMPRTIYGLPYESTVYTVYSYPFTRTVLVSCIRIIPCTRTVYPYRVVLVCSYPCTRTVLCTRTVYSYRVLVPYSWRVLESCAHILCFFRTVCPYPVLVPCIRTLWYCYRVLVRCTRTLSCAGTVNRYLVVLVPPPKGCTSYEVQYSTSIPRNTRYSYTRVFEYHTLWQAAEPAGRQTEVQHCCC